MPPFGAYDISVTLQGHCLAEFSPFFCFGAKHPHALLKIRQKNPCKVTLLTQAPQMVHSSPMWHMKNIGQRYLSQKYVFDIRMCCWTLRGLG